MSRKEPETVCDLTASKPAIPGGIDLSPEYTLIFRPKPQLEILKVWVEQGGQAVPKDWLETRMVNPTTKEWDGEAEHECLPDFSCCNPECQFSSETRERFYKAHEEGDDQTIQQLLMTSLQALGASEDANIHVAGDEPSTLQ